MKTHKGLFSPNRHLRSSAQAFSALPLQSSAGGALLISNILRTVESGLHALSQRAKLEPCAANALCREENKCTESWARSGVSPSNTSNPIKHHSYRPEEWVHKEKNKRLRRPGPAACFN
eukprot:1158050-Pelagomonas_calceolata.AAC.6